MIEQDLQQKIADALSGLSINGLVVFGNLLVVPAGILSGEEKPSSDVVASVSVAVRSTNEFGWLCPLDFACAISVSLRAEVYPTAAEAASVLGPVFDMVTGWVRTTDGIGTGGALETTTFMPGGVRLDGGDGPRFDKEACAWRASINFTVRGRIKPNEEVN